MQFVKQGTCARVSNGALLCCACAQPTLAARREVAKGIADRIQRLADEISSYKFAKPPVPTVSAPDRPSSIEREVDARIAAAVIDPSYHDAQLKLIARRDTPSHDVPKSSVISTPARASGAPKPSPIHAQDSPDDVFRDGAFEAEIQEYMRQSPLVETSDDDVIVVQARGAASKSVPQSSASAKRLSVEAAAAAREKLAGKTAALRRKRVADQVCMNLFNSVSLVVHYIFAMFRRSYSMIT